MISTTLPLPPGLDRAVAGRTRAIATLRRMFFGTPLSSVATVLLVFLVLACLIGPAAWGKSPTAINVGSTLQAPNWAHPMGTDENGRDILARFLVGGRLSLFSGLVVALAAAIIGGGLGLVAGFAGGFADGLIGRAMDAVLAFPSLLLAIAVTVGLGPGVWTAALGILLTSIPWFTLIVRSDTLRVRHRAYIEAAVALGARQTIVLRRHVLPHIAPTILVQYAIVFGYAVLTLAGLGFIGLGAQPPTPEWGSMITKGLQYALTGQWWIGFFPGLGIFIAVAAANILSDQIAAVVDPRAIAD